MSRRKALIVEDDDNTRRQLAQGLRDHFEVFEASDRPMALALARKERPQVIVLDLGLLPSPTEPEEGFRLLEDLKAEGGPEAVLLYTGKGRRQYALRVVSAGARDFPVKPVDLDALKLLIRRACAMAEVEQELASSQPAATDEEMIGTSPAIRQVFAAIRKVATTEVPVLLIGESGTGKGLTAKAIHERSARKSGPFVTINCGAIPETLLEAELFGYEKGAFTGAVQSRKGKVEYAQRGTLFLDEIGEMSLALQVKLLRFLQDRTIERVGGRQQISVDARIIAATHVDLTKAIKTGGFREDLYYRLSVVTITLPPLRERGEDLLLMAQVLLKRVAGQMRKHILGFTQESIRAIEAYSWPGNVRELSNKIRRAVAMAERTQVTPEDLDLPWVAAPFRPVSLREARARLEAEMVTQGLARHARNLSRVAHELGISRPTLYGLLKKYGISPNSS